MDMRLGVYEHYKGGQYRLLMVAKREGTLEDMAVYQPLYQNPVAQTFVRPVAEFFEVITRDGYHGYRFRYVGEQT